MGYSDNHLKYRIINVDVGGQIVPLDDSKTKYIDFYLYCNLDDAVYKMECYDYYAKYTIKKGQPILGHHTIDNDRHIVNIIVIKNDTTEQCQTHFMTVVNEIKSLNRWFKRNINMNNKVIEMGSKYGFLTKYEIKELI